MFMSLNVFNNVVTNRNLIDKDSFFGYLSWQAALEGLENVEITNGHEKHIINDLQQLLIRKGFERFTGFVIDEPLANKDCWKFRDNINNFNLIQPVII